MVKMRRRPNPGEMIRWAGGPRLGKCLQGREAQPYERMRTRICGCLKIKNGQYGRLNIKDVEPLER